MDHRHVSRLAIAFLLLGAACGTSAQLIDDRLTDLATVKAVDVGSVRFDYATWTSGDEEARATAREHEREWTRALREAFLAEANDRGLGGAVQRTVVDITVDDLDPGSRATRYWVGFGAGAGSVRATASVRGHGKVQMRAAITGGAWGGDFANVMEELGKALAEHLAERIAAG